METYTREYLNELDTSSLLMIAVEHLELYDPLDLPQTEDGQLDCDAIEDAILKEQDKRSRE